VSTLPISKDSNLEVKKKSTLETQQARPQAFVGTSSSSSSRWSRVWLASY